eukprot:NODE_1169_length_1664_cov_26.437152_g1036_i0.p1 GENE.NODE_1169_length_1664_cov_26.437152_g1036_i0~~NODE_1169_length_1664_cov_26.437152_g1036_i0.p1  ORF type:complete len:457 (-),score=98.93 NODE_1169_length_1664_cov_26.437152_g1036_i0:232-1602(-)
MADDLELEEHRIEEEWLERLALLRTSDRFQIATLAEYAEMHSQFYDTIVKAVEQTILCQRSAEQKLNLLYLVDCMCKTLGSRWVQWFSPNIVPTFCKAFETITDDDGRLESKFLRLLKTWTEIFPPAKVKAVKCRIVMGLHQRKKALMASTSPGAFVLRRIVDQHLEFLQGEPARRAPSAQFRSVPRHSAEEEEETYTGPEILEVPRPKRFRTQDPSLSAVEFNPSTAIDDIPTFHANSEPGEPPDVSPGVEETPSSTSLPSMPPVPNFAAFLERNAEQLVRSEQEAPPASTSPKTSEQLEKLQDVLASIGREQPERAAHVQMLVSQLLEQLSGTKPESLEVRKPKDEPAALLPASEVEPSTPLPAPSKAPAEPSVMIPSVSSLLASLRNGSAQNLVHPVVPSLYRSSYQCLKCGFRLPSPGELANHLQEHDSQRRAKQSLKSRAWGMKAVDWITL